METIILQTAGHHLANDKIRMWSIQMSSERYLLLPMAAIDHRTPETSRLHPWTRQFTAETYSAQRANGPHGALPTLKTTIMSTRPFLRVNWARSPVPSTYNRLSKHTCEDGHIENQGEVRRFTSQHSHDYISSNWVKCTYHSLHIHLQL